jgi:hypothetical protein
VDTLQDWRGREALPGYGHAMLHRAEGLLTGVAAIAAVCALSACSGSTETTSGNSEPIDATIEQTKLSAAATKPDKLTGPAPTDHEFINELTGFISPSGNVACMIDPSWVRCDIIDRDWSPPPRPADCEFDYGQGISLSAGGSAEFVCAGDTAFGPDAVLPYGESITAGPLRCDSAEAEITCRDVESSQGFSISREAYRVF